MREDSGGMISGMRRTLLACLLLLGSTHSLAAQEEYTLRNKLLSVKYHVAAEKALRAMRRYNYPGIDGPPLSEARKLRIEEAIDSAQDAAERGADYCVQSLFRDWLHRLDMTEIIAKGYRDLAELGAWERLGENRDEYYGEIRAANELLRTIESILMNTRPPCDEEKVWEFVAGGVRAFARAREIPIDSVERNGTRLVITLRPGADTPRVQEACEELKREWAGAWEERIEGAVFEGCVLTRK